MWDVHIVVPATEYEIMQPALGGSSAGGPAGPGSPKTPPPKKPAADRPVEVHKGGSFGIEFPWARGEVSVGGKTYTNVGVRYKGGGSYSGRRRQAEAQLQDRSRPPRCRPAVPRSQDTQPERRRRRPDPAARVAGLRRLPRRRRPRPADRFAEVTLTVPGKYDKELLGTVHAGRAGGQGVPQGPVRGRHGLLLKPEVRIGVCARR